jgi:hypothetical protein
MGMEYHAIEMRSPEADCSDVTDHAVGKRGLGGKGIVRDGECTNVGAGSAWPLIIGCPEFKFFFFPTYLLTTHIKQVISR